MATKIVILNNKKCQIFTDDETLIKKLRSRLSFKVKGVEFTPAYQNGWNGITYLLSKNNKFDLGLLNNVKIYLNNLNIRFIIEDQRLPKIINIPLDISTNLEKYGLIPRDYQLRTLEAVKNNDKGIIHSATGSGKTLVIALITAYINKPTIIYVIGLDLLDQFHKLFSKLFSEEIGYIGNGICEPRNITIATIWTIGKSLNLDNKFLLNDREKNYEQSPKFENYVKIQKLLKQTKLHILDECHVVTTNTIDAIYKQIDPEYLYGCSGTPYRQDHTELLSTAILGDKIINISASELIDRKILAQPIIKYIPVPKMTLKDNYQSVYKRYVVENEYRNKLIIDNVLKLIDKNYTPLVLFKQIKHGNILYDMMLEKNIKCILLSGKDPLNERNKAKELLNNKEINCVVASTIFDIGLDLPILSSLVLAGGGCAVNICIQRVGRVLRAYPEKKHVVIIDFYDQCKFLKKHSMIRYETFCSEPSFIIKKCIEMK